MSVNIIDFDDVFIQFTATFIKCTKTLWINNDKPVMSHNSWTKESVRRKFSYGLPNRTCFPESMFDPTKTRVLRADRYGGFGIGTNGGGGRIGIIDNFQVKGIGRNPLVGNRDDEWHSYGGQSLIDAVLETIYSEVFDHILPVGTVKCRAIILTGCDTAYMPTGNRAEERGPGALLVRDLCARPAHFLRAAGFQMQEEFKNELLNDVERTRRVNLQLHTILGDHRHVVELLGKFLENCASQFTFARLFRIYHGVLSPSNISLDGRWLDLTNVSFVDTGVNYIDDKDLTPFYGEIELVQQFVKEFSYTYAKYNRVDFDITPLLKYYCEEVDAYLLHYTTCLFGLPARNIQELHPNDTYYLIVKEVKRVLFKNPKIVIASSIGFDSSDPMTLYLESMFNALNDKFASGNKSYKAFINMLLDSFDSEQWNCSFTSFIFATVIHALKIAYFSSFFTRGRILSKLLLLVTQEEPEFCDGYINSYIAVAKWIFQDKSNNIIVLFDSPNVIISYDRHEAEFLVKLSQAALLKYLSVKELRIWLQGQGIALFCINNYDFKQDLLRLLSVLEGMGDLKNVGCISRKV